MLFMMHMLGTFLASISSTTPVDKLLKVLKDLHGKLMGIINDSHKRLVAAMEDELRKAQDHIERQRKQQVGEADDDGDDADDNGQDVDGADGDDADDNDQDADGDDEGQEGDGDGHDDDEAGYEDDQLLERQSKLLNIMGKRSQRSKKPKNMSPWMLTKPLKRPRKAKEENTIFFDLISGRCTKEERKQILIEIDDEDITREQLQTLGRRNRFSNRVDFIGQKPSSWKVVEWKQQLLPEHIGYNIGDCDMIMESMLDEEH
ncbi:hypothetical protein K1719_033422 [Acacia pycnantha]|nr:hypothetical protein K1719_033422 [Acacia pycnantha]